MTEAFSGKIGLFLLRFIFTFWRLSLLFQQLPLIALALQSPAERYLFGVGSKIWFHMNHQLQFLQHCHCWYRFGLSCGYAEWFVSVQQIILLTLRPSKHFIWLFCYRYTISSEDSAREQIQRSSELNSTMPVHFSSHLLECWRCSQASLADHFQLVYSWIFRYSRFYVIGCSLPKIWSCFITIIHEVGVAFALPPSLLYFLKVSTDLSSAVGT